MNYEDITTFVFAATGSRSILNTDIEIEFIIRKDNTKWNYYS